MTNLSDEQLSYIYLPYTSRLHRHHSFPFDRHYDFRKYRSLGQFDEGGKRRSRLHDRGDEDQGLEGPDLIAIARRDFVHVFIANQASVTNTFATGGKVSLTFYFDRTKIRACRPPH